MAEMQERISRGSPYAWSQDPELEYPDAWFCLTGGVIRRIKQVRFWPDAKMYVGRDESDPGIERTATPESLHILEKWSPPNKSRLLIGMNGRFPDTSGDIDWERYLSTPGTDCPIVLVWVNQAWRVAKLLSYNPAQKTVWTSVHGFMIPLLFKAKDVFPLLLPEGMGVSMEQVLDRAEGLKAFVPGRKVQVILPKSSYYGQTGEIGDLVKFGGEPKSAGVRGLKGTHPGSLMWFHVENLKLLPESPEVPKTEEAPAPLEDTVDFPPAPAPAPKPVPTPLSIGDRVETGFEKDVHCPRRIGKVNSIRVMPEGSNNKELYYVKFDGKSTEEEIPFRRDQLTLLMPESMVETPESLKYTATGEHSREKPWSEIEAEVKQATGKAEELPARKATYRPALADEDLTGKRVRSQFAGITGQAIKQVLGMYDSRPWEIKVDSPGEDEDPIQKINHIWLEVEVTPDEEPFGDSEQLPPSATTGKGKPLVTDDPIPMTQDERKKHWDWLAKTAEEWRNIEPAKKPFFPENYRNPRPGEDLTDKCVVTIMGEHGEVTARGDLPGTWWFQTKYAKSRRLVPTDFLAVQIPLNELPEGKVRGMSADLEVIDEVIPAQEPVFLPKFQPGQLVSMTREFRLVGYDINSRDVLLKVKNVEIRGGMEFVDTTIVSPRRLEGMPLHCLAEQLEVAAEVVPANPPSEPNPEPQYHAPAPGEDLTGKSVRMTTSQTKGKVVGHWESPFQEKVWKVQSQYGETRPVHQKFLEVEDVPSSLQKHPIPPIRFKIGDKVEPVLDPIHPHFRFDGRRCRVITEAFTSSWGTPAHVVELLNENPIQQAILESHCLNHWTENQPEASTPTHEIAKVLSAAAGELRAEEVENPPKINDLQAGVLIGVGDWLSAMPGRSVKITWDAESQRFIFGIRDVDGTGMDTDYGRLCREAVPVLINAMMDVSRLNQASGLEPIPDGTWHSIGGPTP